MRAPGVEEWIERLREQGVAEELIDDALAAAAKMAAAADAIAHDPTAPPDPGALSAVLSPDVGAAP